MSGPTKSEERLAHTLIGPIGLEYIQRDNERRAVGELFEVRYIARVKPHNSPNRAR